jgi:predicted GIY-YIG superfamily endonuclease
MTVWHYPARPLDRDAHVRDMLNKEEKGDWSFVGPFVYRFYDADRNPLYIGITSGSPQRWHQHRKDSAWWQMAEYVALSFFSSYADAMEAEKAAIKAEQPPFNRQWVKPRVQTSIRFSDGAEAIAAELHDIMPAALVRELGEALLAPERFAGPTPPPPAFHEVSEPRPK